MADPDFKEGIVVRALKDDPQVCNMFALDAMSGEGTELRKGDLVKVVTVMDSVGVFDATSIGGPPVRIYIALARHEFEPLTEMETIAIAALDD